MDLDARLKQQIDKPRSLIGHITVPLELLEECGQTLTQLDEDLKYLKDVFEGNPAYPQNGPLASAIRRLTAHLNN
jgi:hypothetical protein